MPIRFAVVMALFALVVASGCRKNRKGELDITGPTFSRDADGNLVRKFDIDGDKKPDVIKTFKEYPDPNEPGATKSRLIKKEVHVNSDGKPDVRRVYNELGNLMREELDSNLNGRIDTINHIDNGRIVRKDIVDEETGKIVASRYYNDSDLQRVERDTNGDGTVDYWEFYEQGVLDRIGRDVDGDGRADTWQRR